jgi:hypothetical protein
VGHSAGASGLASRPPEVVDSLGDLVGLGVVAGAWLARQEERGQHTMKRLLLFLGVPVVLTCMGARPAVGVAGSAPRLPLYGLALHVGDSREFGSVYVTDAIASAAFNGDGLPDVVYATAESGSRSTYALQFALNAGKGRFVDGPRGSSKGRCRGPREAGAWSWRTSTTTGGQGQRSGGSSPTPPAASAAGESSQPPGEPPPFDYFRADGVRAVREADRRSCGPVLEGKALGVAVSHSRRAPADAASPSRASEGAAAPPRKLPLLAVVAAGTAGWGLRTRS